MQSLQVSQKDKLSYLRKKYPQFIYKSFKYSFFEAKKTLEIEFLFQIEDLTFRPKVEIGNISNSTFKNLNGSILENFIFHLGLIEIPSYWKATCSPIIKIEAGQLNEEQRAWWHGQIVSGLGEFFYQNNIDFTLPDFLEIQSDSPKTFQMDRKSSSESYIALNGGGRDSAVTLELLKSQQVNISVLMLNPTAAALDITRVSEIQSEIIVNRQLDTKLLELNSAGFLNGHTPFSAYLAFLSVLCAYILGRKYTIASNERSSNEQNIEYLGKLINHQYSKSYNFEKSFREYSRLHLSSKIEYLSSLRPLYEIQISKIFTLYKKYFKAFKSCNVGQKTNSWCGQCAKCLSIYISLYPFLSEEDRSLIFPQDLYANEELLGLLLHLTGIKKPKPFECVGTYAEVLTGLRLSIQKLGQGSELPILLAYAKNNLLTADTKEIDIAKDWDDENFLPESFSTFLQSKLKNGS